MSDETTDDGLRARLSRQGEEALGKLAQDLLESPIVSGALQRGFEAREKASQAQEAAMGALNLPSASDLERLTRRVRSVGQRLEGIEDGVDRLADKVTSGSGPEERLAAMEQRLASLDAAITALAGSLAERGPQPSPRRSKSSTGPPAKRTVAKARAKSSAAKAKPSRQPRKPAA